MKRYKLDDNDENKKGSVESELPAYYERADLAEVSSSKYGSFVTPERLSLERDSIPLIQNRSVEQPEKVSFIDELHAQTNDYKAIRESPKYAHLLNQPVAQST